MVNERYLWLDYAKALGIILVVYGHVARGLMSAGILATAGFNLWLDQVIYSFHMPFFFFLSGTLFHTSFMRKGAANLLYSKVDTIGGYLLTLMVK